MRCCSFITPALSFTLLVSACADRSSPIPIGLAAPLSDPFSAPMRRGAELAIERINAAGGVRGRPLVLVERDDYGNADSAVRVATELYDSPVVAVIGSVYSQPTLAAAPVYNGGRHPVLQISPSATTPAITDAGNYTFRVCPSDVQYGAALAQWAWEHLRLTRGAVLYVNNEYGRGVGRTFEAEFTRLGGEVVESDPFLESRPDVGVYLARLSQQKRAGFLVIAANLAEGTEVLRQVRGAGLRLPILTGDGFDGIQREGEIGHGVYVSTGYLATSRSRANREFIQAYQATYPDAGLPDQASAASYDVVHLLAEVIGQHGTSRRGIRDAVARIGTTAPAFNGVIGLIGFDENGDVPRLAVRIGVVDGGELRPAAGE